MIVKLLTEHYLEFLSLKGCFTGSSESTLVKMNAILLEITWRYPTISKFSHALSVRVSARFIGP